MHYYICIHILLLAALVHACLALWLFPCTSFVSFPFLFFTDLLGLYNCLVYIFVRCSFFKEGVLPFLLYTLHFCHVVILGFSVKPVWQLMHHTRIPVGFMQSDVNAQPLCYSSINGARSHSQHMPWVVKCLYKSFLLSWLSSHLPSCSLSV